MRNKFRVKDYVFLHFSLFIYSLALLFTKIAAIHEVLSVKFIIFYFISIIILFVYAILWQQILKKFTLTTVYANKSIVVIWAMIWGVLLFEEVITIGMIIGGIIIFYGIKLVISDEK